MAKRAILPPTTHFQSVPSVLSVPTIVLSGVTLTSRFKTAPSTVSLHEQLPFRYRRLDSKFLIKPIST